MKTEIERTKELMTANMRSYLRALKEQAGNISYREISRRTGVSIAVLSDIEGNKYLPKMEVLLKLAYGMHSSISTLLKYLWTPEDEGKWVKQGESPSKYQSDLLSTLEKEGLSKREIKEVISFINFKKRERLT